MPEKWRSRREGRERARSLVIVVVVALLVEIQLVVHVNGEAPGKHAVLVDLDMTIDGGAVAYVERVLREHRDRVLVFRINSHGGYLAAADKIVTSVVNSGVECIAWVPPGGYAVSAATMVALACRELYMSPGSVVGAVKPVPDDPKVVEYVKGRLRGLLEKQGKYNLTFLVDDMVERARTITADEAGRLGLAKLVEGVDELLNSENLNLVLSEAPNAWEKTLSLLSNQIVAQLMLFAGIVLVLVEVFTTGFQGYGIAGALLIVLALYSLALVPVDVLYLALVLAGAVLLAVELYTPGFGVFGISGIAITAVGLALAFTAQPPEVMTSPVYALLGGFSALTGLLLFIAFSAVKATRIKRKPIAELLVGSTGVAKTDIGEIEPGVVYVAGEDWTAYSERGLIPKGSRVRIKRVYGLKLYVEKVEEA